MLLLRSLFTAKAALLALALLGAPAQAQNSICPDVTAGDSSNRCANTRFVQTQIAAGLPLTNTFVYVGNASNIATGVAISGDCTITNLGILTCTKLNGVSPGTLFPLNAAPAGTLTGATLNGTVTASSLTSVGTLTGGATGAGFTVNLTTSTITGALPAANFPALTGDITTPGGSLATTLATVNANVGSFGGANSIPSFTVNGKGLITAAAANVPAIPFTELTGQATYAQLPTASALAVLGRSANSGGVYADIQCTAAGGGVVKESSSTIVCATILDANISASAAIAYSKFANAGANTVLSNWTAGSAALLANTWPACANDGGHALTYTNGTGVLCTVIPSGGTVISVASGAGISNGTASAITTSGTLYNVGRPQGRLTLQTGVPVMVTTQSAKGTLFYDCSDWGANVSYYNGTNDVSEAIAACEVSDVMVSAASAGQVVNNNVYDVWWVHGGANRICLAMSAAVGGGGGWSSDTAGSNTARGTGYSQLDTTTRPYITNKNSITNCFNAATNYGPVSANQGTYLGTVYATANGQTSWTYGAVAAGGTAGMFGVWNLNRVDVATFVGDNTATWTYAVANTWRAADASATFRVSAVVGINEDSAEVEYDAGSTSGAATVANNGIGLDSTTAFSGTAGYSNSTSVVNSSTARYSGTLGGGFHFVSAIELNSSTTASTWLGGGTAYQTGLHFRFRM